MRILNSIVLKLYRVSKVIQNIAICIKMDITFG